MATVMLLYLKIILVSSMNHCGDEASPYMARFNRSGKIGQGGGGRVFLAALKDKKPVVVKIALEGHPNHAILKEARKFESFKKSMKQVLGDTWRPFFPRYYGSFFLNNSTKKCIIMEYLERDLFHLARPQDWYVIEKNVKIVLARTLQALEMMHSIGWAHRDLKLENLMIKKRGDYCSLKLIDLGFAKQLEIPDRKRFVQNDHTMFLGTKGYLACEIINTYTQGNYGVGVDIFTVGRMLLRILGFYTANDPYFCDYLKKRENGDSFEEPESWFWRTFVMTAKDWQFLSYDEKFDAIEEKIGEDGFDFLMSMLKIDQGDRGSAKALLNHQYLNGIQKECI